MATDADNQVKGNEELQKVGDWQLLMASCSANQFGSSWIQHWQQLGRYSVQCCCCDGVFLSAELMITNMKSPSGSFGGACVVCRLHFRYMQWKCINLCLPVRFGVRFGAGRLCQNPRSPACSENVSQSVGRQCYTITVIVCKVCIPLRASGSSCVRLNAFICRAVLAQGMVVY